MAPQLQPPDAYRYPLITWEVIAGWVEIPDTESVDRKRPGIPP
jgi:hypothetical protein